MHCEERGDFCHHPTSHGFDYFFGTPLTNHRALGTDGDNVLWVRYPTLQYILLTAAFCGLLAAIFLWSKGSWLAAGLVGLLLGGLPLQVWIVLDNQHIFNSGFWRNTELVEQPIVFDRMTQRLVNEGVDFLTDRKQDGQPFLLMMSWLQVHTFLHAEKPFKGNA